MNATEYAVIVNEAYAAAGQNPPYPNYRNLGEGTDYQDEVFTTAPMSDMNLNTSLSNDADKMVLVTNTSVNTLPVLTDTVLRLTVIMSSL